MSSYLVALIVSDFKCTNGNASAGVADNLPVSSCGRPNAQNQLDFGLDVAINSIQYFEGLYQLKFPLPKIGKNQKILVRFELRFLNPFRSRSNSRFCSRCYGKLGSCNL